MYRWTLELLHEIIKHCQRRNGRIVELTGQTRPGSDKNYTLQKQHNFFHLTQLSEKGDIGCCHLGLIYSCHGDRLWECTSTAQLYSFKILQQS